jgi:hypothetical protein
MLDAPKPERFKLGTLARDSSAPSRIAISATLTVPSQSQ